MICRTASHYSKQQWYPNPNLSGPVRATIEIRKGTKLTAGFFKKTTDRDKSRRENKAKIKVTVYLIHPF